MSVSDQTPRQYKKSLKKQKEKEMIDFIKDLQEKNKDAFDYFIRKASNDAGLVV